jgi:class 3 adenylate cyclase
MLQSSPAGRPSVDGFSLIRNYIPRDLARKILDAGKQIESERRLVTVLFADVTGFTALSERMDVEEVSVLLNDCFGGLISAILKYEGTIDKFIGDGIMAIFGAPLAHENDPERAIRCALDMIAEIERFN